MNQKGIKKNSHRRRLVSETRAIALVQTGTQANQFASAIDCANNITNFAENRAGNSFFFPLKTQRRPVLKFLRPYVTRKGMVTKTFHLRKQDPQNTSKFCLGWFSLVPNTGSPADSITELGRRIYENFLRVLNRMNEVI